MQLFMTLLNCGSSMSVKFLKLFPHIRLISKSQSKVTGCHCLVIYIS